MFSDLFTGWHLIIVFGVIILLFGATKLPALAKGVGQSIKIFKSEVKDEKEQSPAVKETLSPASSAAESSQVSRPSRL